MNDTDNFDLDGELEAVSTTVSSENGPRKRGRPKGAKNQFSGDMRALLERHGPAVLRQMCKIASGHAVTRWPVGGGARETLTPSVKEMIEAGRILIDRALPALKSTELSGPDKAPLIPPGEQLDPHATALAVLSIAREAHLRQGGSPTPVIDQFQHREPAPSELEQSPAAAEPTAPAAAVEPKREYQVGETEVFDNGAYIQLVEIAGSNARKWDIRDELNAPYGYSRDRQAAVTRARAIKRSGTGEQG